MTASAPPEGTPAALIDSLVSSAREFYGRGWMWGTSGNLSVRLGRSPLTIAITGTGAPKGQLQAEDIAVVPEEMRDSMPGVPPAKRRPSAETAIHLALYGRLPDARAIYHVHTVASSLVSMANVPGPEGISYLEIVGMEMLKGWGVEWRDGAIEARVPVLANRPSMEDLAGDFAAVVDDALAVPAVLVAGHGLTVWGDTPQQAKDRLEIAEFIFQVLWQQRLAAR